VNSFSDAISRRPGLTLTGLLIVTLLALHQLVDFETGRVNLSVDPSVGRLLHEDDPERVFYERARHIFGSEESVVIALATGDSFSADNLARIEAMTSRLQALPRVRQVLSLTTAQSLRADEFEIEFTGVGERDFSDAEVRAQLREDIFENPLYRGTLVSHDGGASALVVYFKGLSDSDFIELGIAAQVRTIAEEERGDARYWISGSPIVKAALSDALMESLQRTTPAILAIVAGLMFLAFRSLRAVILPVIAILMALVWTLGVLAWLERPLNVVTTLVPPLIITLGLAYAMHVISEYYAASSEDTDRRSIVARVVRHVSLPLIISGATTAAGLLALLLNSLPAIREFSLLSAMGVLLTVLVVLTFIPAALSYLKPPAGRARRTGTRRFERLAVKLADAVTGRRRPIVIAGLLVLAVALVGTAMIEVGTEYVGGFKEDVEVRKDFNVINRTFGGANSFYIVIESPDDDTFVEPENLARIDSLQVWLEEQPEVGNTTSLVDHIKLINQSMHDGESKFFAVPESRQLAKQLLLFGGTEEIDSYVDSAYRIVSILVRINIDDTRDISALVERTRERLKQLPYPLQPDVTGNLILVTRTVDDIAAGQLLSIGAALAVVLLILSALFASVRIGIVAIFPNVLPVAVYFGTLGLLGITLSPTTSLIACITLGIAVDDTIHFLVRFNTEARATGCEGTAVERALAGVIRPVTYTSLALVLSFLVLTTTELRTQAHFGALAAFTIAVAWLMDLTLTPAVSAGMRVVTLWDILRLDLGPAPQNTIPLFADLSLRQARIFALISGVRTYAESDRIMNEGEQATDEVFVVLEGQLKASIDRDGREKELSRMTRGAVVGEGGAFGRVRSASVTALSESRLLRFTADDLEILRRRYPRIAAIVYRNLNRVQSERMARDISRVS